MPIPFETSSPFVRRAPEYLPGDGPEQYGAKLRRLAKSPHYYEVMREQGWGDYDDRGRFRIRQNPDDARLEALIAERDRRISSENDIKKMQASPEYLKAQAAMELMRKQASAIETPAEREARERARFEWETQQMPARRRAMRPDEGTPEMEMQRLAIERLKAEKAKLNRESSLYALGGNSGEFEGMDPEGIRSEMQAKSTAARKFRRGGSLMGPDELRQAFYDGGISRDQYKAALRAWISKNESLGPNATASIKGEIAKADDWWFTDPDVGKIAESLDSTVRGAQKQYGLDYQEAVDAVAGILPVRLKGDQRVQAALEMLRSGGK